MAVGTEFIIDQLKYIVLTESGTTGTVSVGAKDVNITGDIIIPETVSNNGISYTVTELRGASSGNIGFYGCTKITSVYISKTISNTFGWAQFSNNTKLRSINVDPDNERYSSLDGVLYNKIKATLYFYPGGKLDESYIIPNSVHYINSSACARAKFKYIYGTLNYNLNGNSPFVLSELIKLNSFYIKNNISSTFANCSYLKSVNIIGNRLPNSTFINDTSLREVTIGSEVTTGSFNAFSGSLNIETINVDSQYVVDHFKDFFPQITSSTSPLRYVNIGDSVTHVSEMTFFSGSSIREIHLGKNIKNLYNGAFARCTNLQYCNVPDSVKYMYNPFSVDDSIYKVTVPSSVIEGYYQQFNSVGNNHRLVIDYYGSLEDPWFISLGARKINLYSTTMLTSSISSCTYIKNITFPKQVGYIRSSLSNCINLESVVFNGNCPVTTSNDVLTGSKSNCVVYYYQDTIGWGNTFGVRPTQKVFRGEVTVGNYTYKFVDGINGTPNVSVRAANNVKLSGVLDVPQTVTIDDVVYTVRYVADNGFENQYNITSFDMHNQYLEIGKNAFKGCRNLTTVSNTNGITDIYESAFEGCSNLTSFSIQTITRVYHPIPKNCFKDCKKIQSITLSSWTYDIEESAFENCTSLQSINIPDECNHIYQNAFRNCTSLQSVTYGNNLYIIYDNAFQNCQNLRSFTIKSGSTNGLETLKDNVFANCYRLESAPLGAIRDIGKYCFYYNQALTSITLPDTTDYVDDCAFANCNHLTTFTNNTPNNAEFGNDVFYGTGITL